MQDGVLYAHTWENCFLCVTTTADANWLDTAHTAMLMPYLAYTSPDGYSVDASPSDWHPCLVGSYGYDLQASLRAMYAGIPPNLTTITQANQPYPHSFVLYKPGVGFSITFVSGYTADAAAPHVACYILNEISTWLQGAHRTHGFGKLFNGVYIMGSPFVVFDNINISRGSGTYVNVPIDAVNTAITAGFIADSEPLLAPTRYIAISCPELSKRRTIPPTSNISTQAQGSNNLAVFHYDYRLAGQHGEVEDFSREYAHIRVNFSQEAPQELTLRMRDEFGNFITCWNMYANFPQNAYDYNAVLITDNMLQKPVADRYAIDYAQCGFMSPAVNIIYITMLDLYQVFNVNTTPNYTTYPPNALCTTSDFIHLLVLRSS